jgi:hypothetical protein
VKKKILIAVNIILLVGLAAGAGFLFVKNRDLDKKFNDVNKQYEALKNNPQAVQAAEAERHIQDVGRLYDLPKDEKPSVATVSDKEKLKDQPFFAKAENGDITLIYSNAKLAILYRPSTKQIINVSSVTIQNDQQTPAAQNPAP